MVLAEPATNTISQENASTTMVRIAVAMSESVFLIPHFARMAVNPAKTDDKIAAANHIFSSSNDTLYARRFSYVTTLSAGGNINRALVPSAISPERWHVRTFLSAF